MRILLWSLSGTGSNFKPDWVALYVGLGRNLNRTGSDSVTDGGTVKSQHTVVKYSGTVLDKHFGTDFNKDFRVESRPYDNEKFRASILAINQVQ